MTPHTTLSDEDLELPEIQSNNLSSIDLGPPAVITPVVMAPAPEPPVEKGTPASASRKPFYKRTGFYVLAGLLTVVITTFAFIIVTFVCMRNRSEKQGTFVKAGHNSTNATSSHTSPQRNHPRFFPFPPIQNGSHGVAGLNGTYESHRPTYHPPGTESAAHCNRSTGHARNTTVDHKGSSSTIGLAAGNIANSHIGGASISAPSLAAATTLVVMQILLQLA